jgi:hypothetical protein
MALRRKRGDVPTRTWTVLAQDPSVLAAGGRALTTTVEIPAERLERGPKGHRVHVLDYDGSTNRFYRSRQTSLERDHYSKIQDVDRLVGDPYFHQQNVYALVMSTLFEFERALGRPVDWGFDGKSHQIKVAPHAYLDGNAHYSRESESLNFGYFPDARTGRTVFTCLSHDIVVHETTHALLDGLRRGYLSPSSPDQAGFHEGFADIVALLSVFRHAEVIAVALGGTTDRHGRIAGEHLTAKALGNTALVRLGEQFGAALEGVRSQPLRHSIAIRPDRRLYGGPRYTEEHDRGELLVAAVMRTFLKIWERRLAPLLQSPGASLLRSVVAEEGGAAALQLLNVVIRALDYLPPVDMTYRDYLSALLTADRELYPDDRRYHYREALRAQFEAFGITPASRSRGDGCWDPPQASSVTLAGIHLDRLRHDPSAVFRFVWENREALGIFRDAFTRVTSVRPVLLFSRDGTMLRETVAEYVQTLRVFSPELKSLGIRKPAGMTRSHLITLYGGGTLVFNEYGQLKFHIGTGVTSSLQSARLQSLWDNGYFEDDAGTTAARLTRIHRNRVLNPVRAVREEW